MTNFTVVFLVRGFVVVLGILIVVAVDIVVVVCVLEIENAETDVTDLSWI